MPSERNRRVRIWTLCALLVAGGVGLVACDLVSFGRMWLWKSDGTAAGTVRLRRVGAAWRTTMPIVSRGDTVFFAATDARDGTDLWKSDGTPDGTVRVKRLAPGVRRLVTPEDRAAAGDQVFFALDDGEHGVELWKTDGTAAGTGLVKDIAPGPASSTPTSFAALGGQLYFLTRYLTPTLGDPSHAPELWRSDGTEAGTRRLAELRPDGCPGARMLARGSTLFISFEGRLWKSDAASAALTFVADIQGVGGCTARLLELGDRFLILGDHAIWSSDGTSQGTRPVKDLAGAKGERLRIQDRGFPFELADPTLARVGGTAFFVVGAYDQQTRVGTELWRSDGTAAGTRALRRFHDGARELAAVGKALFLDADDGVHGRELWTSDGTPGGTRMVKDLIAGPQGCGPRHLVDVGGRLFFAAVVGEGSRDYWLHRSDGTAEGTRSVMENPMAYPSTPNHVAVMGGRLYWLGD